MFEFLSVFGPAAVTYLAVSKLTQKTPANYFHAALELIVYAGLNVLVMILFLLPFDRVELVIMPNGIRGLRYGGTAYILSFFVALLLSVIISAVRKRFDFELEISPKPKEHDNEK